MMFYGCRSEKADHFFKEEWTSLVDSGDLLLFTAFSRDQVTLVYIVVECQCVYRNTRCMSSIELKSKPHSCGSG